MSILKERYSFKHGAKRLCVFLFDLAGSILFFPLKLFAQPFKPGNVQKILLIRIDHIGDLMMTRPCLRVLRKRFPKAQIDFLIPEELTTFFKDDKEISKVIGFKYNWFSRKRDWFSMLHEVLHLIRMFRREKYDLGIDFRGDLRNILMMALAGVRYRIGYGITGGGFLLNRMESYSRSEHQVLVNVKLMESLGVTKEAVLLPFSYSDAARNEFLNRFKAELSDAARPRIIIHPGAGFPSKRWPARRFLELINKISDEKMGQIILIGSEEEKNIFPVPESSRITWTDLRGKTSLDDLPILFDQCDLFIGNDSGPAHLAAAQGLPVIVIFSGTNDANVWHPWSPKLHLMNYHVSCSPCESKDCPLKHHDCMEKIETQPVFEKVREIFKKGAGSR